MHNSIEVLAILMADSHFTDAQPRRRQRDEFRRAMEAKLDRVLSLQRRHDCPVYHAGDFLDRPDVSHEFVAWMIGKLRDAPKPWWVCPGQHDLVNHSLSLINRSALHVLSEAGAIRILPAWTATGHAMATNVAAFPFGCLPVKQSAGKWDDYFRHAEGPRVAILHRYVYDGNLASIPGIGHEHHVDRLVRTLGDGFNLILTGDNHQRFVKVVGRSLVAINPGPVMRTSIDEQDHDPSVYLWRADNSVEKVVLPHAYKVFDDQQAGSSTIKDDDLKKLIAKLQKETGGDRYNFQRTMERYLKAHPQPKAVRRLIAECLNERTK